MTTRYRSPIAGMAIVVLMLIAVGRATVVTPGSGPHGTRRTSSAPRLAAEPVAAKGDGQAVGGQDGGQMNVDAPAERVRMFEPGGRHLVWLQLTDMLTERIHTGVYPAETRLPSEQNLQQETGAARETIRQAIAELRKRGLIETVPGKGSYVLPEDERQPQTE